MSDPVLLRCPFCGGRAFFDWTLEDIGRRLPGFGDVPGGPGDDGSTIDCSGCNAMMFRAAVRLDERMETFEERYAELAARWNRRAA